MERAASRNTAKADDLLGRGRTKSVRQDVNQDSSTLQRERGRTKSVRQDVNQDFDNAAVSLQIKAVPSSKSGRGRPKSAGAGADSELKPSKSAPSLHSDSQRPMSARQSVDSDLRLKSALSKKSESQKTKSARTDSDAESLSSLASRASRHSRSLPEKARRKKATVDGTSKKGGRSKSKSTKNRQPIGESESTEQNKPPAHSPANADAVAGGNGQRQSIDGMFREQAVNDYLKFLDKRYIEYVKMDLHQKAKETRAELLKVREHEEQRRREAFDLQQAKERQRLEETHMKQKKEFNEMWDRKIAAAEEHFANMLKKLSTRHEMDRKVHLSKGGIYIEATPHWSSELVKIRKVQDRLFKQKEFEAAAELKELADGMETRETEMWQTKREGKIAALEQSFAEKSKIETGGLLARIESGRNEQQRRRTREFLLLLQRHNNAKLALDSAHKIIRQRVEKAPMVPCSGIAGLRAKKLS